MAAVPHSIPELDRKGLRDFGLTTGSIVAVLFGLLLPWLLEHQTPTWPWVLCGVLVLWALIAPNTLRPLYRTWMRFGLLMGRITTPIVLSLVFYLIFTPISLIRALLGRDSLARKFDEGVTSYRVRSRESSKNNLEKPF